MSLICHVLIPISIGATSIYRVYNNNEYSIRWDLTWLVGNDGVHKINDHRLIESSLPKTWGISPSVPDDGSSHFMMDVIRIWRPHWAAACARALVSCRLFGCCVSKSPIIDWCGLKALQTQWCRWSLSKLCFFVSCSTSPTQLHHGMTFNLLEILKLNIQPATAPHHRRYSGLLKHRKLSPWQHEDDVQDPR